MVSRQMAPSRAEPELLEPRVASALLLPVLPALLQAQPQPPEPPEPQISDNEAVAIITDTLTDSEALNIITGGTT